ncbi:condensation domain-containing protein, partial [Microbispora sp. KK1-11]|uniref:condensation domain-containing protein n=1 Tax=Microbispora sp. KK1-11 TaxID=2053005 RepID=UPI00115C078A
MTQRLLSPIEEALWIECQDESGSAAYHVPYVLRADGDLDVDALRAALDDLVARHDALRTGFAWHEGAAVAVTEPRWAVPFEVVDLRGDDRSAGEVSALVAQATGETLDLSRPPLLKCTVLLVEPGRSVVCLLLHHLVTDGRSRELLFDDLVRDYRRHALGESAEVTAELRSYREWSESWHRSLDGGEFEEHRRFWRTQVADAADNRPERLLGGPRQARGYRGRRIERVIGRPRLAAVRRFAARNRSTMSAVLMGAWAATIARLGAVSRVPIGVVSANRMPDSTDIVGAFAGTVPVVVPVDPAAGFAACVTEAGLVLREVLRRPVVPLHRLDPEADRVPEAWRHVFDVMFVHTMVPGAVDMGGLTVTPLAAPAESAKCRLLLTVVESRDELRLGVEYDEGVLSAETAEAVAGELVRVLDEGPARPEAPLATFAASATPEPLSLAGSVVVEGSLHGLFERWVGVSPDAVAVVGEGVEWSYR